jgi:hypothetical protein
MESWQSRSVLLAAALICFATAEGQPAITLNPSPSPDVLLTVIPASPQDSALSTIFGGGRSSLIPVSFYLTDQTTQPVVGLCIVWTATDQTGKQTTERLASDSFNSSKLSTPVIQPGGRILVIPGGAWMPDSMLDRYSNARSLQAIQLSANRYSTAYQVSVQIDTLIFASGNVAGPDTTHFASELVARKQAADAIVALVDSANAGGTALDVALSPTLHPLVILDPLTAWKQRYARNVLMIPNYVDQFLRRLPAPPAFSTVAN